LFRFLIKTPEKRIKTVGEFLVSILPDQDSVVQAMQSPETYPQPPQKIIHLQTHISHIFLTGSLVYKIKKPVNFGFLDFSTLAKRRYFCYQEVLLNRRLTKGIYLGVVKIVSQKGRPVINGKGPILEYAVLMREMPQERMMNRLLAEGKVSEKDIRALVRILVPFYRRAKTGKGISPFGRVEIWAKNTEENFIETQPYVGRLVAVKTFLHIIQRTREFLTQEKDLFKKRIREGFIRDCHGDLHSANICLDKKPLIYDCIEFNHRFRYNDIACDLAFLVMDLDFHRRPDLSAVLQREYVRLSGDHDLPRLFNFYKAYRAYVRAKVHSFTSEGPELQAKTKQYEIQSAKKYYQLADQYIQKLPPPQIVVIFGLMGSGKTSLARALAAETGWSLISSDEIRKNIQGLSPTTRQREPFGKGIYSEKMSKKTYGTMRKLADKKLHQGRSVILDGSYKRHSERLALVNLARKTRARIRFLECQAPLKTIRLRLEHRARDARTVSDGRWELLNPQRRDFDPVIEPVLSNHHWVKTNRPPEQIAQKFNVEFRTNAE
jgi:aminoglycoside phosphotransferase family enzyme/predicted kinase